MGIVNEYRRARESLITGKFRLLTSQTVPLPASAVEFEGGSDFMESNPQDIDSLDLWTKCVSMIPRL